MALMNRRLNHDLETVFLMPAEQFTYTSSRLIKEVFRLGGEVGGLVPAGGRRAAAAETGEPARSARGSATDMTFSSRMSEIAPSPTLRVAAEADRLRRQGVDVVDLGAGEPDFPTPEHISDAARAAIDANFTKYTPSAGIMELREAVCTRYRDDYGVEFSPRK